MMRATDPRRSTAGVGANAVVLLVVLLVVLGAVPAFVAAAHTAPAAPPTKVIAAHEELQRADPADGDTLDAVPDQLRLTFLNPIRLEFARLALLGPDGAVELGELRRGADSARVLVGPIRGPLVAGEYTVQWQVAGPDGHPVRGEYAFTILPDADGLAAPPDPDPDPAGQAEDEGAAPPGEARPHAAPSAGDFDAESPLYAAVRWLTFVGLLGVIGAVTFGVLVLAAVRRSRDPQVRAMAHPAAGRALALGAAAAVLVAAALLLRLYAQSYALYGPADALAPDSIRALLTGTSWSAGWWLQGAGTALAFVGFLLARRHPAEGTAGWAVVGSGALALAFSPALSGHAAAATLAPLAIVADGLHVLGAGGWLGGLFVVIAAGLPVALREQDARSARMTALVSAFSATALFFAGLVVVTGVASAWLHLGSVAALWTSGYGRTLLVKLAVFSVVLATGAYNWLRVRPAMDEPASGQLLRRSAGLELAAALLVLAITAVLVATPPPADSLTP